MFRVILTFLVVALARANDYCNISPQHVLCTDTSIGANCGSVLTQRLSPDEQNEIVAIHNELRAKVANGQEKRGTKGAQPPAANMQEMVWDEELARMAQAHANKCRFKHDCNKCRESRRFAVGQNMYTYASTRNFQTPKLRMAMMAFYNEVKDFDKSAVTNFKMQPSTGHYTQIVWANSNRVGCGYVKHQKGRWYKMLLTCNYGPAGNYLRQPMYTVGKSCSGCPRGTSCSTQYPGLCTGASK